MSVRGLRPLLPYVRWKSYLRYWYKVLNINAYKLNQANLDEDDEQYDFVCKPLKNELTDEEKKLMINNGYPSTKYIVPNPQIPFEELKLDNFSEKNLSRKTNKGRANRALREKHEHVDYYVKKLDDKMNYPACPFAGSIDNKYMEFAEITNEKNTK